ncbi:hypothetical protein, conserved [Eimeria brunetti]|uniref:Uncharacterized protein n=1 Tax=Eimeria brunetti TaxID=51314 RepID=U6LQI0_9EIME|nr:hypothetical protein, conserved [Eimeria brunetti]
MCFSRSSWSLSAWYFSVVWLCCRRHSRASPTGPPPSSEPGWESAALSPPPPGEESPTLAEGLVLSPEDSSTDGSDDESWPPAPASASGPDEIDDKLEGDFDEVNPRPPSPPTDGQQQYQDLQQWEPLPSPEGPFASAGDPPPPERPPLSKAEPSDQSGLATDEDLQEWSDKLWDYIMPAEVVVESLPVDSKLLSRAEELHSEGRRLLEAAEKVIPIPDVGRSVLDDFEEHVERCRLVCSSLEDSCRKWTEKLSELEKVLVSKTQQSEGHRLRPRGEPPTFDFLAVLEGLNAGLQEASVLSSRLRTLKSPFVEPAAVQQIIDRVNKAIDGAEKEKSSAARFCAAAYADALQQSTPAESEGLSPSSGPFDRGVDPLLTTAHAFNRRLKQLGLTGGETEDLERVLRKRKS